jgi:ribulose-bisphosphate carboxylase large chain
MQYSEQTIPPYITPAFNNRADHIIGLYEATPNGNLNFTETINHIAEEATIGSWNSFWEKNKEIGESLRPKLFSINKEQKTFQIAVPLKIVEPGNIAQILAIFAGNIFGMRIVEKLKLLDISVPIGVIENFKGPQYGITGIRSISEIYNRPFCGVMIKPKLGLDEQSYQTIASEIWSGGVDAIFEGETMASFTHNNFFERARRILGEKKRIERETHEYKFYYPNITAGDITETIHRIHMVAEMGGNSALCNPVIFGFPGFKSIQEEAHKKGIMLHATRAGYKLLTNDHGITFLTQIKLLRLLGADSIAIGNPFVHQEHIPMQLKFVRIEHIQMEETQYVLEQNWGKIKGSIPVVSGGVHPGKIEEITRQSGNEVIIVASEGVFYHPDGTRQGAKALREACNAAGKGITKNEHAKKNPALKRALEKWEPEQERSTSITSRFNHFRETR